MYYFFTGTMSFPSTLVNSINCLCQLPSLDISTLCKSSYRVSDIFVRCICPLYFLRNLNFIYRFFVKLHHMSWKSLHFEVRWYMQTQGETQFTKVISLLAVYVKAPIKCYLWDINLHRPCKSAEMVIESDPVITTTVYTVSRLKR